MKKILTSILIAVLLISQTTVQAEISVDYEPVSHRITVSGNTEPGAAVPVTVHLYKADSEFPSSENLPVASGMTKLDTDGKFAISFNLPENIDTGKYNVLCGHRETEKVSVILYSIDSADTKKFVSELNSAEALSDFSAACSDADKMALLGIDIENEPYMDEVAKYVYNVKKSNFDADDYIRAFKYMSAVAEIKNAESVSEALKQKIGVFVAEYSEYDALDEKIKKQVDHIFLNSDYSEGEETFAQILATAKVRASANYSEVADALTENAELFGIDMSKYKSLAVNSRHRVPLFIFERKNGILSSFDVKKLYDEAVLKASEDVEPSGSKQRTSSGGSGGGGGKTVGVPEAMIEALSGAGKATVQFSDISGHFAESSILHLCNEGILNGYSDKTFKPDNFVTRAEFSAICARAFNIEGTNSKVFDDVDSAAWYFDAVSAMSSHGYIIGDGKNFRPDERITRQDAAVIIARIINADNGEFAFSDSDDISGYAKGSVASLAKLGYLRGDGQFFRPKSFITRGETAALTDRIYTSLKE